MRRGQKGSRREREEKERGDGEDRGRIGSDQSGRRGKTVITVSHVSLSFEPKATSPKVITLTPKGNLPSFLSILNI
jgi:hypothetical protein